jgi:hypothetical protein
MAMVIPGNTAQIRAKIDAFAQSFTQLESQAEDLIEFAANLTAQNASDKFLVGLDGLPMTDGVRNELLAQLQTIQGFVNWATTGGAAAPIKKARQLKTTI